MAKLSAHGLQVARLERRDEVSTGTVWYRRVAFMQDGSVLENTGTVDTQSRPGKRWSGWRLVARKRDIPAMMQKYREQGYGEVQS